MKHFGVSYLITLIGLCVAGWWGYRHGGTGAMLQALWITTVLAVMEVSLSFDNAVVNASVLRDWSPGWRKLFLTVGILVAVFGMRLLFPLIIVSQTADLSLASVWQLALNNPAEYARNLSLHHAEVMAFGGSFLMLVFLNFLLDTDKELHWLGWMEGKVGSLGRISSLAVMISLSCVLGASKLAPASEQLAVLLAGIWGILVYVGVELISGLLEGPESGAAGTAVKGGIGGFLYLEVLDASFSFDGVIGAFAISTDIVVILLGLGIGAMFVRSLTVYLVDKGTLAEFVFLEHGAHYAIGILAGIMFLSVRFHIPEAVTGFLGVAFILASLWSSLRHRKAMEAAGQAD